MLKNKINSLIIDSTNSKTDLCVLGTKYPTDKSPYNTENSVTPNGSSHRHPYTAVYDFIFSPIRYNNLSLAEIGVLDNMSMRCWREYFPNTKLYGFEYNQKYIDEGFRYSQIKECCFGYRTNHRHDQSIYSVLAKRYKLPYQSMSRFGEWRDINYSDRQVIYVHRTSYHNVDGLLDRYGNKK
jgi:hypothetical protein